VAGPRRISPKAAALAVIAALGGGAGATWALRGRDAAASAPAPFKPAPLSPDYPAGKPIDAARIQAGRLAVERMPLEVTEALEVHSAEIVKTAEVLERKQARITGTCAPGSAIRVVEADGSVVCQRLPRGAVSVTALAGLPRVSSTGTAQASVPGGVGRYQTSGEDDFLVLPVALPDGAIVTAFSYVYWDSDARVDGGAFLYRSDDVMMAAVATEEAKEEVRLVSTEKIERRRVDNSGFAYFVFMQTSAEAGQGLMPIAAIVTYRLP
jgi:hypothetical protein